MAIRFTIAKRGLLPAEEAEMQEFEGNDLRHLRPQLERNPTVDAVKFQNSEFRLPSVMPEGELRAALDTMRRVMLHELEKGNAVALPGIGTFRLSLKGGIEVKDGSYHGCDVHVDDLLFRPESDLLSQVRSFEVDQVPYGQAFQVEEAEVEARLADLFARQDTITHKDLTNAFELTLTRARISAILRRLVSEGRLIREGRGALTRYRRGAM